MATQVQKLEARVTALEALTKQQGNVIALFTSDNFIENIKNSIETAFNSFHAVEVNEPETQETPEELMTRALKQHIEQHSGS